MKTTLGMRVALAALAAAAWATSSGAQDITVTNARILDGTGRLIERGSVVVRGGRIASIAAGTPAQTAGRVIDAAGRTVMPGFIDAHRHVVKGNPVQWLERDAATELQQFLDAGFTTVLGAIDPPQLIEARKRIEAGTLKGPRLYVGTMIPLAGQLPPLPPPPGGRVGTDPARTDPARRPFEGPAAPAIPREQTLRMIDAAKAAGFDYLKTIMNATPGGPEIETQKFVVEEGRKRGMPTITHAVSVRDTLNVLDSKPALLVHTPHIGDLGADAAALKRIVDANIPMTSTLQVFLPHYGPDGKPLFRDRAPFPFDTLSSAGQGPVNARQLWEAGLRNYGYGTDTQWTPKESLFDELRALSLVFSPADIVTILTKNAGTATLHGNEIGTLEVGKQGDVVIIDGNPLVQPFDLLNVVTTIKQGVVVFEKRDARTAGIVAPNVVVVSPTLVTAGQPDRASLQRLKAEGYAAVINLAPGNTADAVADEGDLLRAQGVEYVHIPIPWQTPQASHLEAAAKALQRLRGQKVLVHCQMNMRASAVTFLYRTIYAKEDPAAAWADVRTLWNPGDQWRAFIDDRLRAANIPFRPE